MKSNFWKILTWVGYAAVVIFTAIYLIVGDSPKSSSTGSSVQSSDDSALRNIK